MIVSTGSRPGRPPIPGIDAEFVVQARDLYLTGPPAADRVVIIGGGDIGCETADWLESLEALIETEGPNRARYVLARLLESAQEKGYLPDNLQSYPSQGSTIGVHRVDGPAQWDEAWASGNSPPIWGQISNIEG